MNRAHASPASVFLAALFASACFRSDAQPANWSECARAPSSALACRLCLMGGEWEVLSVSGRSPEWRWDRFAHLAEGQASRVIITGDQLVVEDPEQLREHKQIELFLGASVQRLHLQHADTHFPGWSGEGSVVLRGTELHLCLGTPPNAGEFECPDSAEHVVLRRSGGADDCRPERGPVPQATTLEECQGPPRLVEQCRLRLLQGTWRVERDEARYADPWVSNMVGPLVHIAGDQILFDTVFPGRKQLTLVPRGNVAMFDLLNDHHSKGWSTSSLVHLRGDVLQLCLNDDLPHWPVRFHCEQGQLLVLRRVRGGK